MAFKIDWVQHYKERIDQINKDIWRSIRKKDWITKKRLEAEKYKWEEEIKRLEGK